MGDIKKRPAPCVECITCGSSHPDFAVEERVQRARAKERDRVSEESDAEDAYGCGGTIVWTAAYRCVDCGRWFHRDCIRRHFESQYSPETIPAYLLSQVNSAVTSGVSFSLRAASYPIDVGGWMWSRAYSLMLGPAALLTRLGTRQN
jgi:hypothetical protein